MKDTSPKALADAIIEELTRLRKEQGLSHEKLAELAGLHRSAISLIESKERNPTLLTCLKICKALEVNLDEIIARVKT